MSMAWVAVGTAVVGAGASLYGANKQSKAISSANDANLAATQETNRQNWLKFLMSRGITPDANTETGQVPGYNPGDVMNTKLPLWAKVKMPINSKTPQLIKAPVAATPTPTTPTSGAMDPAMPPLADLDIPIGKDLETQ